MLLHPGSRLSALWLVLTTHTDTAAPHSPGLCTNRKRHLVTTAPVMSGSSIGAAASGGRTSYLLAAVPSSPCIGLAAVIGLAAELPATHCHAPAPTPDATCEIEIAPDPCAMHLPGCGAREKLAQPRTPGAIATAFVFNLSAAQCVLPSACAPVHAPFLSDP